MQQQLCAEIQRLQDTLHFDVDDVDDDKEGTEASFFLGQRQGWGDHIYSGTTLVSGSFILFVRRMEHEK